MASNAISDNNNNNNNPNQQQQQQESLIPVLTVFKRRSIIKNIFIILNNNSDDDDDADQIHTLLVGRHPNNNIVLTHPSISRFHLQICFTPSSRSISILDSSSVHGTWVSGKKLEHGVSVDLKEGDTFQLGVSSRIYLLHFVSQFDSDPFKKIGSLCYDNEMMDQFQDETFEVDNDSFGTEASCSDGENNLGGCEICFLSPPYVQLVDEAVNTQIIETYSEVEMPAGETKMHQQSSVENGFASVDVMPIESEFEGTFEDSDKIEDILTIGERVFNSEDMSDSESHQTNTDEEVSVDLLSDGENQDSCGEEYESELQRCIENIDPELGCTFEDNDSRDDVLTSMARLFVSELVEEAISETNFQQIKIVEEVAVDSLSDGDKQNKCDKELQRYLDAKPCDTDGNSLDEIVEDTVKTFQTESLNPSVAQEEDLEIIDKKENQTPQSLVAVAGSIDVKILGSCTEESAKRNSNFGTDIRSRRNKTASAPPNQTRKSRLLNTPYVDSKFELSNLKDINIINRPTPKDIFSVLDEEEIFTTPNKEHLQSMRKKTNLEESKTSKSRRSHNLKVNFSPNIIYSAERSTSAISNKENLTPKETQGWKSGRMTLEYRDATELRKKRVERIPLQSLMSSEGNCNSRNSTPFSSPFSAAKSVVGVTARANNFGRHISDKHSEPSVRISEERKRSWDMVVDTSSLLNNESRKALQLLQGLKGTRLVIPQSVIQALVSMKQQSGIFRRISEASLALEWIEECIGNTKWWIHILDCAVEDQILDHALQYRRNDNIGQIVLLSEDITLKIKSMAKGLLCETVQQFRQSLVNPFSERFMWANSSPRGLTWSCRDDVILREKFCCLPPKAGLKLLVT